MAGWLWDKIKGWLNGLVGGIADLPRDRFAVEGHGGDWAVTLLAVWL